MTPKPVVLRAAARQDVDAAVSHYLAGAGRKTALRFVERVEEALLHVGVNPERDRRATATKSTCRDFARGRSGPFPIWSAT